MRRIRVTVTQDDIDRGIPGTLTACPIARALRRRFRYASVGDSAWQPGVNSRGALLSPNAVSFVRDFDTFRPVRPATFLLPVPE